MNQSAGVSPGWHWEVWPHADWVNVFDESIGRWVWTSPVYPYVRVEAEPRNGRPVCTERHVHVDGRVMVCHMPPGHTAVPHLGQWMDDWQRTETVVVNVAIGPADRGAAG